ncbi:MAG: flagellar basal-body rod protein FlgF [Steroidobacteraceae bacterium]|jgi:flagellar basal-body rod protein FlgF
MDRLVYVAMSGAKETLRAQTANSYNLANVSTVGFRADLSAFQSQQVQGAGLPSRAYATDGTVGWDAGSGTVEQTGRNLDVAVQGQGWIAVQSPEGSEAYTRAGDLRVDPNGQLTTAAGYPVLGDSGPIAVPPYASISVGHDGSIAIVPLGQTPQTIAVCGRIKLVNPPSDSLERTDGGLFRLQSGGDAPADATVQLVPGALESSNINTAAAMTNMIELARSYDLQLKSIKSAEDNDASSTKLLQTSS